MREEDVARKNFQLVLWSYSGALLLRRQSGVTGSEPELTRKLNLHIFNHVRVDAAHMRIDAAHMRLQLHICLHICVLYADIAAYLLSTPRCEKKILAKKI